MGRGRAYLQLHSACQHRPEWQELKKRKMTATQVAEISSSTSVMKVSKCSQKAFEGKIAMLSEIFLMLKKAFNCF